LALVWAKALVGKYMGLGTLINDRFFGEERKRREDQALSLPFKLAESGITDPQTVNKITEGYINTGMLTIPSSYETRTLGPAEGGGSPPSAGYMTSNAHGVPVSVLPDTTVETKPIVLGKPASEAVGHFAHFYDVNSGKEIKVEPIAGTSDKYIPIGGRSGGGGGKSQEQIADEIIIRGYESLKRQKDIMGQPMPIDPDYTAEYLAARERRGLPPPAEAPEGPRPSHAHSSAVVLG
jgi:hypothetical protein